MSRKGLAMVSSYILIVVIMVYILGTGSYGAL
jgi:hypothetical protein